MSGPLVKANEILNSSQLDGKAQRYNITMALAK
jgi:hypothetical protein